jgi:hypothetical protein
LKKNYQLSLVIRTIIYEYMSHSLNTDITPAISIPTSQKTHQCQRVNESTPTWYTFVVY